MRAPPPPPPHTHTHTPLPYPATAGTEVQPGASQMAEGADNWTGGNCD